jgi:hypothetical protein
LTVAYCVTVGKQRPVDEYLWAAGGRIGAGADETGARLHHDVARMGGNHVAMRRDEGAYMLIRGGNQSTWSMWQSGSTGHKHRCGGLPDIP